MVGTVIAWIGAVGISTGNLSATERSTFYGEGRVSLRTEDLIEIENAGRRCRVCHSGRGSRRFEVVCPAGREPVVLCGSCRARFGDDPPVGRPPAHLLEPVPAPAEPPAPPEQRRGERGPERRPDRLRAALPELPGSFSTAMAAHWAGMMSSDKALARLEDLERQRRRSTRWQALVDRVATERGRRSDGSAPSADEQRSRMHLGTRTGQLTSRQRGIAG